MGGAERVARQHAAGKLTVRERVERLLDAGSFHETGALAGKGEYDDDGRADGLPAGQRGRRPGPHRRAPRGGPGRRLHRPRRGGRRRHLGEDGVGRARRPRAARPARAPRRRHGRRGQRQDARDDGLLLRAAAAGLRARGREPLARARSSPPRSGRAPGSAPRASSLSHFSVIVRGSAQLFVAGPPVVAAAMGESPDKEALGGARAQTRAGAVDNEAADEDDALDQLRRFLSYLPGSAWEAPPIAACSDPVDRREEELLAIVPRERRQTYRHAPRARARPRRRLGLRARRALRRARSITALGAPRRAPGRRPGLRPQPLRRRADRRRVGQARALRRHLRRLPPAGRQLRRPAGLRHRHRGRAGGDDAPRRARAGRRAPGAHAVVLGARAQGLRRRRRGPRRRLAAEPALRVAAAATGARCRSTAASRRPTGASSRPPRIRSRCAPRSRRA